MSEKPQTTAHQDILNNLQKRVMDFKDGYRHNMAILGEELCGKTTLLKSLIARINDEKLLTVYCEILPFEFSLFLKRCLDSLFYNYLKNSQLLSTRENLEWLIKRAKEPLPQTTLLAEQLLGRIDKEKPENLFKDLFAVFESLANESHKKCIIIFDEFHHLNEFGPKNIWQELGKKIMLQKNALFLFASSSKNKAKEILSDQLALLFGNFETIELGMLKTEQCELLVANWLGDIVVPKDFVSFLVNFTGGHPFYLKTICEEAAKVCRCRQTKILEKDIITHALQHLLFNEWGTLHLKFSNSLAHLTTNRNKNEYLYLLSAIATGKNRLKDLTAFFRRQKQELNLRLKKLTELEIISKNGSFFCLCDRLMSFWLKFVWSEKLRALSPEYTEQALHFRSMIESELEKFIAISGKNVTDRMLDLFNLFEGDDIQIDRKRFQLSTFKELKIIHFENTGLKAGIFARAQDSLWLAAIKEDGINEHDVNEFIQTSKKFKHKTINKLIIGLGDIERNARLLAKESRILTWDISSINNLLDLFGQPRIIK